jgi:menaquinone-dependent protoporphyrinogen oxidase
MKSSTRMNRRHFLILAGGTLGASTLMCSGVTLMANQIPTVDFVYSSCGKEDTMEKVLIAYASKYGSTGEVAQAIGHQLCQRGMSAEVRRVEEVTDLSPYTAVIVGSAIRMGNWLPAGIKFVEEHAEALRKMPTATFTVHMLNIDGSEASQKARAAYVEPVHALIEPDHEVFFGGRMDVGNLTFLDRFIARMVKAEDADLRDWGTIEQWTDEVFVTSRET